MSTAPPTRSRLDSAPATSGASAHDPVEQSAVVEVAVAPRARARRRQVRKAEEERARLSARAEVALRRALPGDQPAGRSEPAPASALRRRVDRGPSAPRKMRRSRGKAPDTDAGFGTLLEQLVTADLDPGDPASRDPAFIRATAPFFDFLWSRYFRAEVEGAEHVPASGPFIAVGNHSGGPLLPDVWLKLAYWSRHYGTDRPAYAMVHDLPFAVPIVKNLLLKLGALRASPENAERALAKGGAVLIYPGGDADCLRSFWKRNTVDFFGHTGFITLALRHDVPILPVVNVGAHEVYFTLFSSRALARWSGIEALTRVKTVPLNFGLPWGMWLTGFLPYLPLPSKIVYKVGKPIRCPGGPARADDPATVQRVYRRVTRVMQEMVDDLASRRRLPVVG